MVVAVLAALAGPAAATAASVSPSDRAATDAYLEAEYRFDKALLASAAADRAAESAIVEGLVRECRDVLTGAPEQEFGGPRKAPLTPRARGERERGERELSTIQQQLYTAVREATHGPREAATDAFVAAVTPLRWSDPRVAASVRARTTALEEHVGITVASVCADLKAWAASAFRSLPADSRSFQAHEEERHQRGASGPSVSELLRRFEGPHERAILRRTAALQLRSLLPARARRSPAPGLLHALGERESYFEEREHRPLLGRGTTAAGTRFAVYAETTRERLIGPRCAHSVSIEFERTRVTREGSVSTGGSGSSECISKHPHEGISGSCGEDVQSFDLQVPANVVSVRLALSDRRTITSGVVAIPRGYGGPVGVYAQAIHGYSPYPLSLTELDRKGRTVKVEPFRHVFRCHREPRFEAGPTFVTLASGKTPDGDPFSIQATIVHFGRNQTSFNLDLTVPNYNDQVNEEGNEIAIGGEPEKPKAFPWSVAVNCPPDEYEILYGILAPPGATVLARTPAGLEPLTKVSLAAHLHSGGPLVFGAFPAFPSELIIQRSDGSTLYTESLAKRAHEHAEFCEGYAEP